MGKHCKQTKGSNDNTLVESMLLEQIKYLFSEKNSIQTSFLTIISFSLGAYGIAIYYAFLFDAQHSDEVNYVFIMGIPEKRDARGCGQNPGPECGPYPPHHPFFDSEEMFNTG